MLINFDHQDHFSVSDDLRDEGHTMLASDLRTMWKAEKQQSKDSRLCIRLISHDSTPLPCGVVHTNVSLHLCVQERVTNYKRRQTRLRTSQAQIRYVMCCDTFCCLFARACTDLLSSTKVELLVPFKSGYVVTYDGTTYARLTRRVK